MTKCDLTSRNFAEKYQVRVLGWDDLEYYRNMYDLEECDEFVDDYRFCEFQVHPYFNPLRYDPVVGTIVPYRYETHGGSGGRNSDEYREWRTAVLRRDNYTCQWCGATKKLEVHHKRQVALYPEAIFVLSNGITLCRECHATIEIKRVAKSTEDSDFW